jgi:hypothetical protein
MSKNNEMKGEPIPFGGWIQHSDDTVTLNVVDGGAKITVLEQVNHPKHYTSHPSGVECIQITEHMGFNLGNAIKYIWRADEKGRDVEDMHKAIWYINREISKRTK